jgi:hypothetical protein
MQEVRGFDSHRLHQSHPGVLPRKDGRKPPEVEPQVEPGSTVGFRCRPSGVVPGRAGSTKRPLGWIG